MAKGSEKHVIFWFRSDLRLSDNPGLAAAVETGAPVVPVYILDDDSAGAWKRGGASKWWLHHSLAALDQSLQKAGFHPLIFLQGNARKVLPQFVDDIGASDVFWNRCYEPWAIARDTELKKKLPAHSFNGYLLFEPWDVKNKTGDQYKVFTPFYRACLEKGGIRPPIASRLKPIVPEKTIKRLALKDLGLIPEIKWYAEMEKLWQPGEAGAQAKLKDFISGRVSDYKAKRDFPAVDGVSQLSPHLHFGEVSPHQVWAAAQGQKNAEPFMRQLIWREFSYHLLYHAPDFPDQPWNKQFKKFPWLENADALKRWQKGLTGYPIVDAGMRQLWRTGWMHNRVRMIVGSFLVKNLLIDWREGELWFWDTLLDADLGNNAAGWQWIAGCGADAAPYFRIFNPILQSKKFDPDGTYIRHFVPELKDMPHEYLYAPWEAPPLMKKQLKIDYPEPIVDLSASRDRALEAYGVSKDAVR
jgi:deoxyribodipyrimidine photo-lyase